MEQCSICLEAMNDGGVVALACNHRFQKARAAYESEGRCSAAEEASLHSKMG